MSTEPEALETERIERDDSTELAVLGSASLAKGPAFALARLTDEQFEQVMSMAVQGRQRLQAVMRAMMKEGVHYGVIPGGPKDKKILFQPGAQVLRQMFRLVAEPVSTILYGDGDTAPSVTVTTRCFIHMDDVNGPVVGIGEAACSSWEVKYRYRAAERLCPECNQPAIRKSSYPDPKTGEKGWYCFRKVGGCGAQFTGSDPRIIGQEVGRAENPDQYDLLNTIVAMAEKRAKNRATIDATASADLFTHDLPEVANGDDHAHDPDSWRDAAAAAAPPEAPKPVLKPEPKPEPKPQPWAKWRDLYLERAKLCGWRSAEKQLNLTNNAFAELGASPIKSARDVEPAAWQKLYEWLDARYDEQGKWRKGTQRVSVERGSRGTASGTVGGDDPVTVAQAAPLSRDADASIDFEAPVIDEGYLSGFDPVEPEAPISRDGFLKFARSVEALFASAGEKRTLLLEYPADSGKLFVTDRAMLVQVGSTRAAEGGSVTALPLLVHTTGADAQHLCSQEMLEKLDAALREAERQFL